MRDYLTLSWARFSKDVQSHTLQISKILSFPAPRPGEIIRLDASAKSDGAETSLEVVARFPGGLDFGRGLVDINFTMWPLFKCLNIDNILTICEVGLPSARCPRHADDVYLDSSQSNRQGVVLLETSRNAWSTSSPAFSFFPFC